MHCTSSRIIAHACPQDCIAHWTFMHNEQDPRAVDVADAPASIIATPCPLHQRFTASCSTMSMALQSFFSFSVHHPIARCLSPLLTAATGTSAAGDPATCTCLWHVPTPQGVLHVQRNGAVYFNDTQLWVSHTTAYNNYCAT